MFYPSLIAILDPYLQGAPQNVIGFIILLYFSVDWRKVKYLSKAYLMTYLRCSKTNYITIRNMYILGGTL